MPIAWALTGHPSPARGDIGGLLHIPFLVSRLVQRVFGREPVGLDPSRLFRGTFAGRFGTYAGRFAGRLLAIRPATGFMLDVAGRSTYPHVRASARARVCACTYRPEKCPATSCSRALDPGRKVVPPRDIGPKRPAEPLRRPAGSLKRPAVLSLVFSGCPTTGHHLRRLRYCLHAPLQCLLAP